MNGPVCYNRALVKLSGEAFFGNGSQGNFDFDFALNLAKEVQLVQELGVALGIVVGGGNFWRGKNSEHFDLNQHLSDYAGMAATVMNGALFGAVLEQVGLDVRVYSTIELPALAAPYRLKQMLRDLEKDRVVIFSGGTGTPGFTTDTAAASFAGQMQADIILLAKNGENVRGVHTSDPKHNPEAELIKAMTHLDIVNGSLAVMDATAATHALGQKIPINVFGINVPNAMRDILTGCDVGTFISSP